MPTPFRHWLRPSTSPKSAPTVRLRVESLEDRDVPATFAVTTTVDSGAGSLRQAILNANSAAGADTIAFAIGSGPVTIAPLSGLPTVTGPTTIDGWSQPGFAGTPIVELSGASAGKSSHGLFVSASGVTIRGLVINRFAGVGLWANGAGATGMTVQGCYIGTNSSGTTALANGFGVYVANGAKSARIGTNGDGVNDAAEGNVISGNGSQGVWLVGASNSVVAGNRIGTNAAGTAAVPNNGNGIIVNLGATNVRVGTNGDGVSDAAEGNVLSGNAASGIAVGDAGTNSTVIAGNLIGTNAAGTAALGNTSHGVSIEGKSANTVVGTNGDGVNDAAEGNVISGNGSYGVFITGAGTTANVVAGNFIGTDVTGQLDLGNTLSGVRIAGGASDNLVGGTAAGAGNVLSGNGSVAAYDRFGVLIDGTGTDRNRVQGNLIGLAADGATALGNSRSGVGVIGGPADTLVGGPVAGARNVIAANAESGVYVQHAGTSRTVLQGNFLGTTADGTAARPNARDGVTIDNAPATTLGGSAAGAGNLISGNAQSGVAVIGTAATGSVLAGNRIGTNAAGTAAVPNRLVGVYVAGGAVGTVVGTNGDGVGDAAEGNLISGNTFQGVAVYDAATRLTVVAGNRIGTNAAGTAALPNGEGILVQVAAGTRVGTNGDGVADADERNVISGNGSYGVSVFGAGTDGTVVAGNFIGTDATGSAAVPNANSGLIVWGGGVTNTRIGTDGDGVADAAEGNVISGNAGHGIRISEATTKNTVIAGNVIGLNAAGTATVRNVLKGVYVSGAAGTRIGTNGDGVGDAAERNVISGNGQENVLIDGGAARTTVAGNTIGTNAAGTAGAGGTGAGVSVIGGTDTVIGTNGDGVGDAAEGNLISGNGREGVYVANAGTRNTIVAGNVIGLNAAGTAAVGNGVSAALPAVVIRDGTVGVRVGTNGDGVSDALERNVISGNLSYGVSVAATDGAVVAGNYIGTNAAGTAALGNDAFGVLVTTGSTNTRVGTNGDGVGDAAEGNVVSGHSSVGVYVLATGTNGTVVAGNRIGTTADGTAALGNFFGVYVAGGSKNTRVGTNGDGTSDALERNVISGNRGYGVTVTGAGTDGTVVAGNTIGTNAAGTASLGTQQYGVVVYDGVKNTRVGTNGDGVGDAAEGNVISGHSSIGVYVADAGTDGTLVAGNFIGTNAAGTGAVGNAFGVYVAGGAKNTRVGGPTVAERNLLSGNSEGVFVLGGATGTLIQGNFIGTNAAGDAAIRNTNHGVRIEGAAVGTVVGTNGDGVNDAGEGNLISGNANDGVTFWVGGAAGTVVAGNRIGTDAAGTAALGNGRHGVWVNSGATNTRVGTNADGVSDALERNVISGNGADGVQVADVGTTGTVIAGNFIGTNAAGDAAIGNLGVGGGVYVRNGASNTTVGGTAAAAGNVLSGNSGVNGDGVEIELSSGNFVYGNRIGTDATGSFAIPNRQNGVNLDRATGNFVGGPAPGAGNLISGNARTGVLIGGSAVVAATANTVQGNRIGTDATGTAALPNLEQGVLLLSGAGNNTVGTNGDGVADAAEGNVIAFNGLQGVAASGSVVSGNAFRGNAIFGNGGLGIDLSGDGVTPNDPLDADGGPNGSQNFPLLTARTGFATRVAGLVPSRPNTTYLVDFYANPAGTAQGARYLGTVSVTTDAAGNGHFDATLAALTAAGEAVTATATDPAGNTSEFSAAATPPLSVESVVVNQGQAQRSRVTRIDVTFSGVLPAVDATAFALTQVGGPAVGLVVASAVVGGKTVVTVTFTGPGVSANSLSDGNYTFTIDGAKLLDAAGRRVDADGDGLAGGTGATSLFRLFGDSDGDRDVDNADFFRLRTALLNPGLYSTYAYFDFNGDGAITAADRAAFDARRGTILLP